VVNLQKWGEGSEYRSKLMNIYISIGTARVKYIEQTVKIKNSGSEAEYVARHTRHTC